MASAAEGSDTSAARSVSAEPIGVAAKVLREAAVKSNLEKKEVRMDGWMNGMGDLDANHQKYTRRRDKVKRIKKVHQKKKKKIFFFFKLQILIF